MRTAFTYSVLKRWLFVAAVAFVILMNYLSNALPFGGMTNAEISARYPTLITPAGYAFSIWGVIYLTLAIFAFFQLRKGKEIRFYKLIWPFFIINAVANALWLVAFQNEWFIASLVMMATLLGTLIAMFRIFYRLKRALSTTHRYFFHVPFGIYFGWVSVASIVNVAVVLTAFEVTLFTDAEQLWAMVMLIVGFGIAAFLLITRKDYIYTLTFVWAYSAIMYAHMDVDSVRYTAKFSAIGLFVISAALFLADRINIARYGKSTS